MKSKLKIAVHFFVGIQLFLFVSCSQPSSRIESLSIQDQKIAFGKELFFDKQLSIKSRSYDTKRINDFEYIVSIQHAKNIDQELPAFMNPVKLEFARLLQTRGN